MDIYPAIDLYEGKVVRLVRGQFDRVTVYSEDPIMVAKGWEEEGAAWIHLVDLEGARIGTPKSLKTIEAIRRSVACRLQLGGGLRSADTIARVLDSGVDRAVIGTRALDEKFLTQILSRFKSKIAISLDSSGGTVYTDGWLKSSGHGLQEILETLNRFPVETLIHTDIQTDGMLQGPNFSELEKVLSRSKAKVLLSGGVSTLSDVEKCYARTEKNFGGVIVGKALYDMKFTLKEALQILAPPQRKDTESL